MNLLEFLEKKLDFSMKSTGPAGIPGKKGPHFCKTWNIVWHMFIFFLSAIRARKVAAREIFWCPWKDMQLYRLKETKADAFPQIRSPE